MDTKKRATRVERQVADALGGRRVPLSGSGMEKGDVNVAHKVTQVGGEITETSLFAFRVEVKTTGSHSFTLRARDWYDVVVAAGKAGQIPLMVIEVRPVPHQRYRMVVMRANFYRGLRGDIGPDDRWSPASSTVVHSSTVPLDGLKMRRMSLACTDGDVALVEYNDFLQLVRAAEQQAQ